MACVKGGDIEIKILTMDSKTYTTRVEKNVSVPTLKQEIARLTGVIPEHQRLLCGGRLVRHDQNLSAYHVDDGHTLHLVETQPSEPTEQDEDLRALINRISAGEASPEIDEYEDEDEDVRILAESIYPSTTEAQEALNNLITVAFANNDAILNQFAGDRDYASFSALLSLLQGTRQGLVQYLLNRINDLEQFAGTIHGEARSVSTRADIIDRARAIIRMPATEMGQPPADGSLYFLSNVIQRIRSENNRVEPELPSRRRTREDDDLSGQQAAGAKRRRRYSL